MELKKGPLPLSWIQWARRQRDPAVPYKCLSCWLHIGMELFKDLPLCSRLTFWYCLVSLHVGPVDFRSVTKTNEIYAHKPQLSEKLQQNLFLDCIFLSTMGHSSKLDFKLYNVNFGRLPVQVWCMRQSAQGRSTRMTLRDGMGRKVGGGFRMGNICTPMADSCQCMAKTTTIL